MAVSVLSVLRIWWWTSMWLLIKSIRTMVVEVCCCCSALPAAAQQCPTVLHQCLLCTHSREPLRVHASNAQRHCRRRERRSDRRQPSGHDGRGSTMAGKATRRGAGRPSFALLVFFGAIGWGRLGNVKVRNFFQISKSENKV